MLSKQSCGIMFGFLMLLLIAFGCWVLIIAGLWQIIHWIR